MGCKNSKVSPRSSVTPVIKPDLLKSANPQPIPSPDSRRPPQIDTAPVFLPADGAVASDSLASSPLFRDIDGDVAHEFLVESPGAQWKIDIHVEEIKSLSSVT
jgi:hypothetical protein